MAGPTIYAELNAVLRELVESAQAILGVSFCGAYLQGSFALGDADEESDFDFVIVTHDEVSDAQAAGLQAMHERIFAGQTPWAQHLEGSYVPRERLRRVDPSRSPWLYLDNGATELIRDNHCNTAVVRWSLREHGACSPDRTRRASSSRCPRSSFEARCRRRCANGRSGPESLIRALDPAR